MSCPLQVTTPPRVSVKKLENKNSQGLLSYTHGIEQFGLTKNWQELSETKQRVHKGAPRKGWSGGQLQKFWIRKMEVSVYMQTVMFNQVWNTITDKE